MVRERGHSQWHPHRFRRRACAGRLEAVQVAFHIRVAANEVVRVCRVLWVEAVGCFPCVGDAIVIGIGMQRDGFQFWPAANFSLRVDKFPGARADVVD